MASVYGGGSNHCFGTRRVDRLEMFGKRGSPKTVGPRAEARGLDVDRRLVLCRASTSQTFQKLCTVDQRRGKFCAVELVLGNEVDSFIHGVWNNRCEG